MSDKLQQAQALTEKAKQKENDGDLDVAFQSYIEAAQIYLHLMRTSANVDLKAKLKLASSKVIDRAERIKRMKSDVVPARRDMLSEDEQQKIIEKSSSINGLRLPPWEAFPLLSAFGGTQPFIDPMGQPDLSERQRTFLSGWKRPAQCLRSCSMVSADPRPENLVQDVVTDCSLVAALAVCINHRIRFLSRFPLCSLYPQDDNGLPRLSSSGKYVLRLKVNGIWRAMVVDDLLPTGHNGTPLCATTKDFDQLWPSLIEKAYIRILGGYDFRGSNSSIDLHALTGWIPEHINLADALSRSEQMWRRILTNFRKGTCMVTAGTGALSTEARQSTGLIPLHDYAIIGLDEVGGRREVTLLNSWNISDPTSPGPPADLGNWTQDMLSALREDRERNPVRMGIFVMEWEMVCAQFDSVYLSWNPEVFQWKETFHCSLQGSSGAESTHQGNRKHFRIELGPSVHTDPPELWVLLSRHIERKDNAPDFLGLNILELGKGEEPSPELWKHISATAFSDSPQILVRYTPRKQQARCTLIISRRSAEREVRFSLTVLSGAPFTFAEKATSFAYHKTIRGAWQGRSAGGNHSLPTFMNNPQYRLIVHPKANSATGDIGLTLEANDDQGINVKLAWSKGERIYGLSANDVLTDSAGYSRGLASCFRGSLSAGTYTIVVSCFEAKREASFTLGIQSSLPIDVSPIPQGGAGMYSKVIQGRWSEETAGGRSSLQSFFLNPRFHIEAPVAANFKFRLQAPNSSTAINLRLFERMDDGDLGTEMTSTGTYSDAVCGVATALLNLPARTNGYFMVPSTFAPGDETSFQIFVYSDKHIQINTLIP